MSFLVIAAAELGDKSQLLALAFATRFRPAVVLAAITAATLGVHLLSVVIGQVLGLALPMDLIQVLAGVSFIGYGLWTVRGDRLDGEGAEAGRYGPFVTVAFAFLCAELGDKTQLATVSLASQYQAPLEVWIGSTAGMVVADAAAIGVGAVLGRRLPQGLIKWGAAALFFAFGVATIVMGLR
jgi:putative Ca2+/H+ antiporter (TMEM165/GDT1 family)